MTPDPVYITLNTSVRQATKLILKHSITALAVIEDNSTPIGVVTDAKLLQMTILAKGEDGLNARVSEFKELIDPPVLVREDEGFIKVTHRLISLQGSRLLVMSDDRRLIGIISPRDLLFSLDVREN